MNKGDFINWPENLIVKAPNKYNSKELEILISNLEKIRFSKEFRTLNGLHSP